MPLKLRVIVVVYCLANAISFHEGANSQWRIAAWAQGSPYHAVSPWSARLPPPVYGIIVDLVDVMPLTEDFAALVSVASPASVDWLQSPLLRAALGGTCGSGLPPIVTVQMSPLVERLIFGSE